MTQLNRLNGRILLEALLAVIFWGGAISAAKFGVNEIPVLTFTCWRLLLASFALFGVAYFRRQLVSPKNLWKQLLIAGLTQAFFQLFLIAGLNQSSAGEVGILTSTSPLMIIGWLVLTAREQLLCRQWFGVFIGLAGVILVVQDVRIGFFWSHLSGNLLSLCAAGAWAWYSLVIGRLVATLGTLQATGWSMLVATLISMPLAFAEFNAFSWSMISWKAWAGFICNVIIGMVLGMALWGIAVKKYGAGHCAVYLYLQPIFTIVIAALLLRENIGMIKAVGTLIILLGVWLASAERRVVHA